MKRLKKCRRRQRLFEKRQRDSKWSEYTLPKMIIKLYKQGNYLLERLQWREK
jgi:hypothetical protein